MLLPHDVSREVGDAGTLQGQRGHGPAGAADARLGHVCPRFPCAAAGHTLLKACTRLTGEGLSRDRTCACMHMHRV